VNIFSKIPGTAGLRGRLFIVLFVPVVLATTWGCSECADKGARLSETLTVLNWEDYIQMDVVRAFEKEFGVKVIVKTFENEDEMMSLVRSDPGKYDLAVASGSIVKTMIDTRLITQIDKANIPNASTIDPEFSNTPNDPGMQFSIPYLWGTSGIAVNRRYVSEASIDWGILFDDRFRNKIDMLDDIQEDFAPAFKLLGDSINERDQKQLKKAADLLRRQKRIIRGYFSSLEIQGHLLDGSTYVAFTYSGDALKTAETDPDIEYIVPSSGAPIWLDSWVVPATSRNKYTAEVFINYILKPENIGRISNYLLYANAVSSSKRYLNSELTGSRSIYLPPSLLARCEYYRPLDEKTNQYLNRVWYELLR
jgi:spermidine/putrescine transport system substrate-binding protein